MKRERQFDEVMIVNPSEGSINSDQRVRLMRFHNIYPPELGGFAEPDLYGYYGGPQAYGYYGEPEPYGYFAQEPYLAEDPTYGQVDPTYGYYGQVDPTYGYYGQVDPTYGSYGQVDPTYGYYGQVDPTYGYYGQVDPTYGYYAQEPELHDVGAWDGYGYGHYHPAGYPEPGPVGSYAEDFPVGYYNQNPEPVGYYGQVPEMVGYGEPEQQFAEEYPGVAYYGEPDYSGYVRDSAPSYNPGCPLPTNVSGFDDGEFGGYARPATVNPSCQQFTEQPGSPSSAPDTFKPLW